jgi:cytochrome c oxidase subunit 2
MLNYLLDCMFLVAHCDAPEAWQLGIQDPATPVMEGMLFFHNYLLFFLIVIGVFVFWLLTYVIIFFNEYTNPVAQKFTHSSLLEIVWTILPAIVLLLIAVPSFALLYSLDELIDPTVTLKVIGHQWYWSYEYADYTYLNNDVNLVINFDSYMVPTNDLVKGSFRLLEVDNRVVLPINTHIRILVTAADVLHSWAIPSFGIKLDGCPGRLSQTSLFIKREGVYYGQCSEICGVNHGFMPIVVRGVSSDSYSNWIASKIFDILKENNIDIVNKKTNGFSITSSLFNS